MSKKCLYNIIFETYTCIFFLHPEIHTTMDKKINFEKDTVELIVVKQWSRLTFGDVERVSLVVFEVRQHQRAPRVQLLLTSVNIRL